MSVYYEKSRSRYRANVHIGYFDTREGADAEVKRLKDFLQVVKKEDGVTLILDDWVPDTSLLDFIVTKTKQFVQFRIHNKSTILKIKNLP